MGLTSSCSSRSIHVTCLLLSEIASAKGNDLILCAALGRYVVSSHSTELVVALMMSEHRYYRRRKRLQERRLKADCRIRSPTNIREYTFETKHSRPKLLRTEAPGLADHVMPAPPVRAVPDYIGSLCTLVTFIHSLLDYLSIPCPGKAQIQGPPQHCEACHAVCRLGELIREQVWKIRMLSILKFFSEVVTRCFVPQMVNDLTWRQETCT